MNLYTYHVDFRGGTYCTQVSAMCMRESLDKWIERIRIEQKEIQYLGDKIIMQLENEINDDDNKPVLLNGLKNIWFTTYLTSKGRFWIHIIQTDLN